MNFLTDQEVKHLEFALKCFEAGDEGPCIVTGTFSIEGIDRTICENKCYKMFPESNIECCPCYHFDDNKQFFIQRTKEVIEAHKSPAWKLGKAAKLRSKLAGRDLKIREYIDHLTERNEAQVKMHRAQAETIRELQDRIDDLEHIDRSVAFKVKLKDRDNIINDFESRLITQATEMDRQHSVIDSKEATIHELQRHVKNREVMIKAKRLDIIQLENTVRPQRDTYHVQVKTIKDQEDLLKSRERALHDREDRIDELRTELDKYTAWMDL